MYCRKCGEKNPEDAIYCRNCGEKLKEEVKKPEIIETPRSNNHSSQTTSTTTSSSDNGSWIACCCIGILFIFILSAIFSGF